MFKRVSICLVVLLAVSIVLGFIISLMAHEFSILTVYRIISVWLYFLPTAIVVGRKGAIWKTVLVNVTLGWTILGWIAAMFFAFGSRMQGGGSYIDSSKTDPSLYILDEARKRAEQDFQDRLNR